MMRILGLVLVIIICVCVSGAAESKVTIPMNLTFGDQTFQDTIQVEWNSEKDWGNEYIPTNYIGILEVVKSDAAIREGPGADKNVVGGVEKGEQFYYKAYADNGWYQLTGSSYVEGAWIIDESVKLISWGNSGGTVYLGTLKNGDSGDAVRHLQMKLSLLGYDCPVSGQFSNNTELAVSRFQSNNNLNDDGIAGPETLNAIENAISAKINNADITVKKTVYNLAWSEVNGETRVFYGVERDKTAIILDLVTGKAFSIIMRWGPAEHIEAEPYNARATEILCDIYGADSASQLPFDRNKARPMLVQTEKGYQIVCTLYPTPHDPSSQTINNNNFDGVFCIHFTGSRTHGGNVVHAEYVHTINMAKEILRNTGRTVTTITD